MNIRNLYSIWYDKQRVKSVKSFVQNVSGKNVLDVGSGIGIFNDVFREIGSINIFAVDSDRNVIRYKDTNKNSS
jgi:2-polyprenyl-3-methyl-5-hydroxy-6-metoxy-1,4-benzoquinol methylase